MERRKVLQTNISETLLILITLEIHSPLFIQSYSYDLVMLQDFVLN